MSSITSALDAVGDAGRTLKMLGDVLLALGEASFEPNPDTLGMLGGIAHDRASELADATAILSTSKTGLPLMTTPPRSL